MISGEGEAKGDKESLKQINQPKTVGSASLVEIHYVMVIATLIFT